MSRALCWGIRAGFRDYIGALTDLTTELVDVEFDTQAEHWVFPLERTGASLHLNAHGGALDVVISDPRFEEAGGKTRLVNGNGDPLAVLADSETTQDGMTYRDVALTVEGSLLFGGVYGPWARMDPVHVIEVD
jgi:hypothetical protein